MRRRRHRRRRARRSRYVHRPVPPAAVRWARRIAPVLVLAVAVGACASGDDAGEDEAGDGEAVTDASFADDGAVEGDGGGAEAAADGADAGATRPVALDLPAGRRVIQTAEIGLEIRDTATALERITTIATRSGGYVASVELYDETDGRPAGTVTLRVPTGRLDPTLSALEDLAVSVPYRQLGTEDVTEEYADIEARLDNLAALETELVGLLAEVRASSADAGEILEVFERIREVRGEIDRLTGRQQLLDDLVALATVRVQITPAVEVPGLLDDGRWRPAETARAALSATVSALAAVGDGVIWVVLTVLPVVALLLVPLLAGWWTWRRARARRSPTTT